MTTVKDESSDLDELVYAKVVLVEFCKKYDVADVNDLDACGKCPLQVARSNPEDAIRLFLA